MSPESTQESFGKPSKEQLSSDSLKTMLVEKYGFQPEEAENLFADSAKYSPKDAYHNFLHHREIFLVGMQIVDEYISEGKDVDAKVMAAAFMLHDAEDPDDPEFEKYPSPEHHAGAILYRNRNRYGLSEAQAERGRKTILASAIDAEITNDEEEIMVIADVSNVGSEDRSFFKGKSALLKIELLAKGAVKTTAQFDELSVEILSKLWLKIAARNPTSRWVQYASVNIKDFIDESVARAENDMMRRNKLLGKSAVQEFMKRVRQDGTQP